MPYTVNDFLVEKAPQIGTDINQKMMQRPTPWITLYKQSMWEDEVSSVQKTFQFDRVILKDANGNDADPVDWENMSKPVTDGNSDGSYQQAEGHDIPPADEVAYSQTIRDYNLQHKAVWGPPMNTNKLRDKMVRVQQMNACVKAMADQTREFWIERKRLEYTRIADKLVVLDSGFTLANSAYGTLAFPTSTGTDSSILTNGFLDEIYDYLNLNGAADGALGMTENRPVYGLVTSARQSRRLVMADPDIREDFRYSSQNEKLLGPMGLKWTYNGFSHITDDTIPRWEFKKTAASGADGTDQVSLAHANGAFTATATISTASGHTLLGHTIHAGSQITTANGSYIVVKRLSGGTTWTVKKADGTAFSGTSTAAAYMSAIWYRVPQFVYSAGLGKRIPNPAWLSATWEDSYIFHQDMCESKVPKPITSVGKAQFDSLSYAGEIKWTNYSHRDDNPDGTIGQFRCVLANGTKPLNPEFGIAIRHLAVPRPDGRVNPGDSLGL